MPTVVQTPRSEGKAEKVGRKLYRKQILPVGSVKHDGKELKFTPDALRRFADNFNAGKMDQVPLILVNDDNSHSQDPEKVRGEVTAMEVHDDGLYGLTELNDRGEELVKDNSKLGASARINLENQTIEHVALTVNPVVKGMKAWEAINLSNDDVTLFDLSDSEFTEPSESTLTTRNVSTDALTPEQAKRLAALADRLGDKDVTDRETLTDEDIAKLLTADAKESEEEEPVAALSDEAKKAIELAKKDAKAAREESTRTANELAEAKWQNIERDELEKGVPPSILRLAKPHLSTASSVVELSKSDSQASTMMKMIREARGTVELAERGRSAAEDDDEAAQAKELAKSDAWEKV